MSQIWGCRYHHNQLEPLSLPENKDMEEMLEQWGQGVYTTLRTYQGNKVLLLQEHLRRLEHSGQLSGITISIDETGVRKCIRALLNKATGKDIRVRIMIPFAHPQEIIGLASVLNPPSLEDYHIGVAVETRKMHRENPEAKVTQFVQTASEIRKQIGKETHEIIMVNEDGKFLEGLSSNFFAVHHGEIWTAEEGILPGITRKIVMQCIKEWQFPLIPEGYPYERLFEIDEAFITSTSRGILPVRKIDQYNLPEAPGEITRQLSLCYQKKLSEMLEEI